MCYRLEHAMKILLLHDIWSTAFAASSNVTSERQQAHITWVAANPNRDLQLRN